MKRGKFFFPICILLLIIFYSSCGSDSTSENEQSRTITVTLRNLEDARAVHIYFETQHPDQSTLVNPGSNITTAILARRVGHNFNVYVDDAANPGGVPLLTTSVTVTQTSWNSREAELRWNGTTLERIGW